MKSKKIIGIVRGLIIIIGIVVTCILGLNFDLIYSNHKDIEISIGQEFENQDIYEIVKEEVGNQRIEIQKVELYEDVVSISIKDITDEQLANLNKKINEKYGIENTVESITITEVPNLRGKDLIKPYILPIVVSLVIIVIYLLIYNKIMKNEEVIKYTLKAVATIIEIQLLYLSILAISRLPINRLTVPFAIAIYVITTIIIVIEAQNKYNK